jgi:hypothetical protein
MALDPDDEYEVSRLFVGVQRLLTQGLADDPPAILDPGRYNHLEVQVLNLAALVVAVFAPRP